MPIRFGISGWRAITADDFTSDEVSKGAEGACSVATSHLVDSMAGARGVRVYETPVDSKYSGELINADKIILGGEESAGLSVKGHYPPKDGFLACVPATEAVVARGASLTLSLMLYAGGSAGWNPRIGFEPTPALIEPLSGEMAGRVLGNESEWIV